MCEEIKQLQKTLGNQKNSDYKWQSKLENGPLLFFLGDISLMYINLEMAEQIHYLTEKFVSVYYVRNSLS